MKEVCLNGFIYFLSATHKWDKDWGQLVFSLIEMDMSNMYWPLILDLLVTQSSHMAVLYGYLQAEQYLSMKWKLIFLF